MIAKLWIVNLKITCKILVYDQNRASWHAALSEKSLKKFGSNICKKIALLEAFPPQLIITETDILFPWMFLRVHGEKERESWQARCDVLYAYCQGQRMPNWPRKHAMAWCGMAAWHSIAGYWINWLIGRARSQNHIWSIFDTM